MKVENFEQACQLRGYDHTTVLPNVSMFPAQHQKALTALAMLIIIAEAMNEGKEFDWNDDDQCKWYPWFDMEVHPKNNPSGFRFYGTHYVNTITGTAGGSRLCYHSSEDAKHAGTQFESLYRDINVITK